jgi:magnesium-transporting ATPase (P-type)
MLNNSAEIYNKVTKKKDKFKIVAEFPFDSDRKRMSLIVKNTSTE